MLFISLPVVGFLGIITSEGAFSISRVLLYKVPDSPLRQSIPRVVVLLFNTKASFSAVWRLSLVEHETVQQWILYNSKQFIPCMAHFSHPPAKVGFMVSVTVSTFLPILGKYLSSSA